MEFEGSLPHSQQPDTLAYPKLDESIFLILDIPIGMYIYILTYTSLRQHFYISIYILYM